MRYVRSFGLSLLVGLGAVAAAGTASCTEILGIRDKTLTSGAGGAGGSSGSVGAGANGDAGAGGTGTGGGTGGSGTSGSSGSSGSGGSGTGGDAGAGGGNTGCTNNSQCGLDTACLKHVCDVGTGKCSTVAAPMGTDCSSELPNGYCSAGVCVKCDATAPAALLAGGQNDNPLKVVLLRNNGATIVAEGTTKNGVYASLPFCLPAASGDDIGVWSEAIGIDFSTALHHTVALNPNAKVQCITGITKPDASFLQSLVAAPGDFSLNIGGANPSVSAPNCSGLNKDRSLTWFHVQ